MIEDPKSERPTNRYDSIWIKVALIVCLLMASWTTVHEIAKDRENQTHHGIEMHLDGSNEVASKEPFSEEDNRDKTINKVEDPETHEESPLPKPIDLLPSLDSVLESPEQIQKMLHFSIVGFPKCGTTDLKNWMVENDEICIPEKEFGVHLDTTTDQQAVNKTVKMLYRQCPGQTTFGKRGFKFPSQLYTKKNHEWLRDHFPTTKLIVGVRHPVLWFQSFYNYKIRIGVQLPNPQEFLNNTHNCRLGVCIDRANMHAYLSYLGKTAKDDGGITSEQEELLSVSTSWSLGAMANPPLPQKVFLYDVTQLDSSKRRHVADSFWKDLSEFMELSTPETDRQKVPENHDKDASKIDICDPSYRELREKLVEIGKASSQWILNHFIPHKDVTISSPKYLALALRKWGVDPCKR